MSQLIKLQNFVSRYEQDIYHYSSHFVRVKNEEWSRLKKAYEAGDLSGYLLGGEVDSASLEEDRKDEITPFRKRMKQFFIRARGEVSEPAATVTVQKKESAEVPRFLRAVPADEQELKQSFLDYFLTYQLKWALSTNDEEPVHFGRYQFDRNLRFFLQRIPDNCLVLYKPVLEWKNTSLELEIILLTPSEAWCLTVLEAEDDAVFVSGKDRFWTRTHHDKRDKKVLDPTITLKRMQWILEQIFAAKEIVFPIRKGIICRNGYINQLNATIDQEIIDKRRFDEWFSSIRHNRSAMKNLQLKAAQALLVYGRSMRNKKEEELMDNHGESRSERGFS